MTLLNACGAAAGGWALDQSGMGFSALIGAMGGLILIPGVLWVVWMTVRRPEVLLDAPEG